MGNENQKRIRAFMYTKSSSSMDANRGWQFIWGCTNPKVRNVLCCPDFGMPQIKIDIPIRTSSGLCVTIHQTRVNNVRARVCMSQHVFIERIYHC